MLHLPLLDPSGTSRFRRSSIGASFSVLTTILLSMVSLISATQLLSAIIISSYHLLKDQLSTNNCILSTITTTITFTTITIIIIIDLEAIKLLLSRIETYFLFTSISI